MDKFILKQVVLEQRENFDKPIELIPRAIPENFISTKKISVISGVRRSGKSTILRQISKKFHKYAYLNFEDDRLMDFKSSDFDLLIEVFMENNPGFEAIFFDEIQIVEGFERFIRRLFDTGVKVFITGSNAKLLSSELSTSLTGRHLKMEIFPFSFREYLSFKDIKIPKKLLTSDKITINKNLAEYIEIGGFPEIVKSGDKEELRQLYRDILIKDLIVRFKIREIKDFKELSMYLMTNISSPVSFNNLKNTLGLRSTNTVKSFIEYFEESYINFSISKYDYSLKKQIINAKKVYAIDTGLINAVSLSFSENFGALLENLVFIELKRRKAEIYYFNEESECDFVLREGRKIKTAIQVCDNLFNEKTREREIKGLLSAMDKFSLENGKILVFDGKEEEVSILGKQIHIEPIYQFLLEEGN